MMQQMSIPRPDEESISLPKLEITCSSTHCEVGLHYFGAARRKKSRFQVGLCKDCGADLVDWSRVHKRVVTDVEYTVEMLKRECWRHDWWHREIDIRAQNHARRKGRLILKEYCRALLAKRVGSVEPFRDGAQTPKKENVVFYAQHATGTCCRKCLEYWHGIRKGTAVSAGQLDYLTELIMRFVLERMPDLGDHPEKVPRIPKQKA